MKPKKNIGIDLDEVIFPFLKYFLEFYNRKNKTNFAMKQFNIYELEEVLGISKEQMSQYVKEFSETSRLDLPVLIGAIEGIKALKNKNNLYAITGRQNETKEFTENSIKKYFNGSFSGVHLADYHAERGFSTPKYEICKNLGIDLMIEDHPKTALEIAEKNNIPVIVPARPWNKNCSYLNDKIYRVDEWGGIIKAAKRLNFI